MIWAIDTQAHIPVLLDEVLEVLDPQPGQVYLDGTAGLGGHASAIAHRLGPTGTIVLMDLDPANLEMASERVRDSVEGIGVHTFHASYVEAPRKLASLGLCADRVLLDLGFASNQVDDPSRGLSFRGNGPLDMRLDPTRGMPASEFLAMASEDELGQILREFGEERQWRRIARKLIENRDSAPIRTSGELAGIVRDALGPAGRAQRIDPATRTFQALRIAVNDELGHLEAMLGSIERADSSWLTPDARIAVISFHSLEDRPVKRAFASMRERGMARVLTRRPIIAGEEEKSRNPRARSAKMRAAELVST
ncbi:MAG: 16S rRNA (cytosine(1402)-N(4))-methyltransferase RsmH [Planctomycetota bacterium]|jgi:16S rRNA (cytosine1402-N4)-methyltransferase